MLPKKIQSKIDSIMFDRYLERCRMDGAKISEEFEKIIRERDEKKDLS